MADDEGTAPRVLGIEGTAWAASAAVYDAATGEVVVESDAYRPAEGGINPREAAEHMQERVPAVIEAALGHAAEMAASADASADAAGDADAEPVDADAGASDEVTDRTDEEDAGAEPVDCVAFSRGPGLGPCLRVVGTAARSVAQVLDVPLVGVNHMVAHLEIGRHRSGFSSPVCLNASGANAHVLGYNGGRYRVLGETMDTGVGNALDKVARHFGWDHPGGPKIERAARDGEYVELPYVVKGMDFSFAGLASAAQDAYDEGVPVEDVCRGLEETVFAMLAEVSERALSLTGSDELVLGGGVAQNRRLQAMLEEMCEARGAELYVPEDRFLRDNAGMIAVLGAAMYRAGDTVAVEDSRVRPDFRPDEVPVTWRGPEPWKDPVETTSGAAGEAGGAAGPSGTAGRASAPAGGASGERPRAPGGSVAPAPSESRQHRGAEAVVTVDADRVVKRRVPKPYRHPDLDARLRRDRTVMEARLTAAARARGVPTPVVREVDPDEATLVFEAVGDRDLGAAPTAERVRAVGGHLAAIHGAGFVHGDPTTRNVRVVEGDDPERETYLIDFGLGFHTDEVEDYAMDLHVFEGSVEGTAEDPAALRSAFEEGYRTAGDEAVLDQLRAIESRGRYQ